MTLCPHRLQLQTLWTGAILIGKMIIWRDKCLAKVLPTMVIHLAGNLLVRFYLLQVANWVIYTVTAKIPINC